MSKHPIFKLSAGVVMGVTGGIMLISSIVLVVQNAEAITSQFGERIGAHELAAPPNVSPRMCADHLNMSGFSASVTGSSVSVAAEGIADTNQPLEMSSLAAVACPGYQLSTFCMGADCDGGLEMVLTAHKQGRGRADD